MPVRKVETDRKAVSDMKSSIGNLKAKSWIAVITVLSSLSLNFADQNSNLPEMSSLRAQAKILSVEDQNGNTAQVHKSKYVSSMSASKLNFVLSAKETKNPVSSSAPLQYFWELESGDPMSLTLSAGSGERVKAQISELKIGKRHDYIIRMTAVDGSGMAMSDSALVQISVTPENQITVEPKRSEMPVIDIWQAAVDPGFYASGPMIVSAKRTR